MQRYTDILHDSSGSVIATATVNVYLPGTTTAATIYSDDGTTTKDNPFLTGTDGLISFYAANGLYDLVFTKTGYTFTAGNTTNIQLFDPAENVNTTSVGNITTGEDNLMTYSLKANSLSVNKHAIRITAWGTTAGNGNSKTVKLYFGSTALVSSGALAINAKDWYVTGLVVRTSATAQEAIGLYRNETPTTVGPDRTTPGETLSGAVTIKCTGESTDTDDIVQRGLIVELLNSSG